MRAARQAGWLALMTTLGGGCTVPLGTAPDAAPCRASADFFVSDLWPRYLASNTCGRQGCHDADDGHGYFRLRAPTVPPAVGTKIESWPDAWRANYLEAIQLLRCDLPAQSRLVTVPAGVADPHGDVGVVVNDLRGAAQLVIDWVASP